MVQSVLKSVVCTRTLLYLTTRITFSRDGRQHSAYRYCRLPCVGFYAFQFNVFQSVMGLYPPHVRKEVKCFASASRQLPRLINTFLAEYRRFVSKRDLQKLTTVSQQTKGDSVKPTYTLKSILYVLEPDVDVDCMAILLCIRIVLCSNFALEIGYSSHDFRDSFRRQFSTINFATTTDCHTVYSIIR